MSTGNALLDREFDGQSSPYDGVIMIRDHFLLVTKQARNALIIANRVVKKHGRANIAAELLNDEAKELVKIHNAMKTFLEVAAPSMTIEDLPS